MSAGLLARLVAAAVGVWLIAAPAVLDYGGVAADNDRIIGPIAGAFAFVACWEVLAALRWATVPLGAWLIAAPAVLAYDAAAAWCSSVASGVVIAAAAWIGRDASGSFGGGWRSIRPAAWRSEAA